MTDKTKEYQTTKEECQRRIDENNNVCPGCGGPLIPLETVDNSYNPTFWAGCSPCMSFSDGVRPRIFKIADAMVREHDHTCYSHTKFPSNGTSEEKEYWAKSQIRGTCKQIQKILILNKVFENERN
jgi:hypothetical protein